MGSVVDSIFGSNKKKKPAPPPPPPAPVPVPVSDEQQQSVTKDARRDERRRAAKAKGRNSTILTGGLGVQEEANTRKSTLLGQ